MNERILIGSPVHQKPAILREFLASLDRLRSEQPLAFFFIDDNEETESKKILSEFAASHGTACRIDCPEMKGEKYLCNEERHCWEESQIWKVAEYKDRIIQEAQSKGYDYLFLIDSDVVLHPRTLARLIQDKKEIISNIYWTKWSPDLIPMPQVWVLDSYTLFEHGPLEKISEKEAYRRMGLFLEQLKKPGVYEVGGLGACTLISKPALQRPVSFKKIKNISFWGEDRHFCIRASAMGLSLFVDTHYPAYHIYRESDLSGVDEFKKKSNC